MECNIYATVHRIGISRSLVTHTVACVLKEEARMDSSVSIHFVGLHKMKTLNYRYRGKDAPTDVLSFGTQGELIGTENDLGDLFLCVPYVKEQAKRFGVSYREECLRMIIHGVLHLLGYDHQEENEAKIMFEKQESLLARSV